MLQLLLQCTHILKRHLFSEIFNETFSDTCVCPKACDIVHYITSMSYASANQNHEERFDLSKAFLFKTGKNLNESLDTKERILPDRRRANIEEAERVIRELPQEAPTEFLYAFGFDFYSRYDIYINIMTMGMHKMQEVFQIYFINGWDSMIFL